MKSRNFREGRYFDRLWYRWSKFDYTKATRKIRKAQKYGPDPKYF